MKHIQIRNSDMAWHCCQVLVIFMKNVLILGAGGHSPPCD